MKIILMQNKKGWIKIVEAFIAIMLIMGVLLVLYTQAIDKPRRTAEIYKFQKTILDEIAADTDLRNAILEGNGVVVENYITDNKKIPPGFEFGIRICEPDDICGAEEYHEEIYSSERIISVTLESEALEPKKIKIFMWVQE